MKITPASTPVPTYSISDFNKNAADKGNYKNFHVSNIDEYVANDCMRNTPVRLDHFTIGLLIQGGGNILLNMDSYTLKKNSLFILTPNKYITFKGHRTDTEMLVIAFTQEFLIEAGMHRRKTEIFNYAAWYNNPNFSLTDNEVKVLHNIMSSMRENFISEEVHFYKPEVLYHGFNVFLFELASILSKYRIQTTANFSRKEDILNVFTKLLNIHFKEERSVQYYAAAMSITSNHLSKTIKELTNKPCRDLIDGMVIVEEKYYWITFLFQFRMFLSCFISVTSFFLANSLKTTPGSIRHSIKTGHKYP